MARIDHQQVNQKDTSQEEFFCSDEHDYYSKGRSFFISILVSMLVLSVILNLRAYLLLYSCTSSPFQEPNFVGLTRDVPIPIVHDNISIDDEQFWGDPRYNSFTGMVALDDNFVKEHGLLESQRWPWDSSKGIYFLYGFHSIHCVQVIRTMLVELRHQRPLTWLWTHIDHCMFVLLDDTLCSADDTPRYTGSLHAEAGHSMTSSGVGTVRMCRDWNKLYQFAIQNSACYSVPLDRPSEVLDRYKHCPDGSRPWGKAN